LKQLLLILLDNALKYTPEGGTVLLGATREQRDGEWGVSLRVADSGPGISAQEQAHVFERFYRADPARGDGGAGLGLAIAQWIVDEHRGRLEIDSAPGRGSTFTVWLPEVPLPAVSEPIEVPAAPVAVSASLAAS
jgi:signal transduction histidine kinase